MNAVLEARKQFNPREGSLTDFDKRLDLYRRDPKAYADLYGRGEDSLTKEEIADYVRTMISNSKNALGEVDTALYEEQRKLFSSVLGVELPKYQQAVNATETPATPPNYAGCWRSLARPAG